MTDKYSKFTGWCSANGSNQSQHRKGIGSVRRYLYPSFIALARGYSRTQTYGIYTYDGAHVTHALLKMYVAIYILIVKTFK